MKLFLYKYVIPFFKLILIFKQVDECRKDLFIKKGRSYDLIPPTQSALLQHIRRATYQGVFIWGQSLTLQPNLPSPLEWGWLHSGQYKPNWILLPQLSETCMELIHCGCKVSCSMVYASV